MTDYHLVKRRKVVEKILSKCARAGVQVPASFDLVSYSISGNFLEVSAWSSGGGLGQFSHICGPDRTELAPSTYLQINYKSHKQTFHKAAKGRRKNALNCLKSSCMGGSTGGEQNIRTE